MPLRAPFLVILPLCLAAPAFAQQQSDAAEDGDIVMAGIGLGAVPRYEGSRNRELIPVPGVAGRIGGHVFSVLGNRASVDLLAMKSASGVDFELGPVVSVGFNRATTKGINDARIRALGTLGYAVELGGYAGISKTGVITSAYDRISASLTIRHDVAGAHGGTLVTPALSYFTPLSTRAMVLVQASATRADESYARANFGITPAQSTASTLPAFAAHGGWKNWSVGTAASRSLTGDLTHGLSLVGGVLYSRLLNDFAASPVTSVAGSRDQLMMAAGLAYVF
jgi:outer membrane scaffolding protein for murein synthesis (MipA/OmpV family)